MGSVSGIVTRREEGKEKVDIGTAAPSPRRPQIHPASPLLSSTDTPEPPSSEIGLSQTTEPGFEEHAFSFSNHDDVVESETSEEDLSISLDESEDDPPTTLLLKDDYLQSSSERVKSAWVYAFVLMRILRRKLQRSHFYQSISSAWSFLRRKVRPLIHVAMGTRKGGAHVD